MAIVKLLPIKDVHIANHSRWNYYVYQSGRSNELSLGSWDWPSEQYSNFMAFQSRILMQFALPAIPIGAVITSAKLKMYLIPAKDAHHEWNAGYWNYDKTPTLNVHKVLQDWDQGSGDGQSWSQSSGATWTNRTASGYAWTNAGGSYDGTPVASKTETWDEHWWEFDIASLVQQWYADTTSNKGLMVKYDMDGNPQGRLWSWSRETYQDMCPYIELIYNTSPEKPRGLVPNFDSFVCYDLSHTTHFKWNFVDTAATPSGGKADAVFMINTSYDMAWNRGNIRNEISRYIDRMDAEGISWQVGIVSFSSLRMEQPLTKYGWFTRKDDVIWRLNNLPSYVSGAWPKSGLEGIMDGSNGALSFPWRGDAKKQIMICTNSPFYNKSGIDTSYWYKDASDLEFQDVVNELKNRNIICSVGSNTHCTSYTQLVGLPAQTGGQYFDEVGGWGGYLKIYSQPFADESTSYDEGDYQSRADLRIFKIQPSGARDQIWSYTVTGSQQELMTKGLGVPWEEGASYEWDVKCYDSSGLVSPLSDRAKMTYIIDVSALVGVPMYNEPIKVGETINKKALLEFRGKLYDEVRKYRDLDATRVLNLFNGEVVPSKDDMTGLQGIMNQMLQDDGESLFSSDLISDGVLGVSDIEAVRNMLVQVSYSPPDRPAGGRAIRSIGQVQRPVSVVANNANSFDTTIDVIWTPSEYMGAGWSVKLNPSIDADINYYKFYHEQIVYYGGKPLYMLTEAYFKSEQIQNGSIFVPDTGRTDSQRMWYTPHDMNGRTSWAQGDVWLDWGTRVGTPAIGVNNYIVQYQQKAWSAIKPDPNGLWYQIYSGGGTSFTHTVSAEASYWYRVKAVDQWNNSTDWTYTTDITYVKY